MIVMVRDKTYSGHEEPILLLFDPDDHINIHNMTGNVICIFPSSMDQKDIQKWMNDIIEEAIRKEK